MIHSFAFVLFIGKLVSWLYNIYIANRKIDYNVYNTFERRNICKKTANANLCETITYGVIFIVALIIGK